MSKIESALQLASEGFYVFPLAPNAKTPAIKKWNEKATRDITLIRKWWEKNPDYNIGVYTGRFGDGSQAIVAVDVDVKSGKRGDRTWKELRTSLDLPRTRRNKTPSGGSHILYISDTPARTSAEKLGEGIDIRSGGGFIAAPGSTIDGATYTTDNVPLSHAPSSLIEKCGRPREKIANSYAVDDIDLPAAVDRAKQWLIDGAPKAIEGRHGDHTTFQVAAKVKDFGISELTALELLYDHWNAEKASPPWEYDALATKVSHAYRYGDRPIGVASPQADFDTPALVPSQPEHPDTPKVAKQKLYFLTPDEIDIQKDQRHLIRNLLTEGGMTILYGESNTGKTFMALKLAYCVATGTPFNNQRTEQGAVVYFAAEAGRSIHNRVQAIKKKFNLSNFPLAVVPCPIDMLSPKGDTDAMIDLIEEAQHKLNLPIKMVIVDTLSRAIAGGDENGPTDMGKFVTHCDKIRHATKAQLLVVHHSGKDKAKGARGHSLLRAATDTELELSPGSMKATKQRDMDAGRPVSFNLEILPLGQNEFGEDITSCVVIEHETPPESDFDDNDEDLTPSARAALEVLKEALEGSEKVALDDWRNLCGRTAAVSGSESEETRSRMFRKARTALADRGLITVNEQNQTVSLGADRADRGRTAYHGPPEQADRTGPHPI